MTGEIHFVQKGRSRRTVRLPSAFWIANRRSLYFVHVSPWLLTPGYGVAQRRVVLVVCNTPTPAAQGDAGASIPIGASGP
jgi:hypothetical protein